MTFHLAFLFGLLTSLAHAQTPLPSASGLDARGEGVYRIRLSCRSREVCDPELLREIDLVSITDSHRRLGVEVAFASSQLSEPIGIFDSAVVGPSPHQLSADASGGSPNNPMSSRFAYMDLSFDPKGEIEGHLQDADISYDFVGRSLARVGDLATSASGPAASKPDLAAFAGVYRGFVFAPGKLTIAILPNQKLAASFSTDAETAGVPELTLRFNSVVWNSDLGLLQMNFVNPRFDEEGELSLAIFPNDKRDVSGVYFTGARYSKVKLKAKPA